MYVASSGREGFSYPGFPGWKELTAYGAGGKSCSITVPVRDVEVSRQPLLTSKEHGKLVSSSLLEINLLSASFPPPQST